MTIANDPEPTNADLLAFARGWGLDLGDYDTLVRAAAAGLMVRLWRNTELENIHAHGELYELFKHECGGGDPEAYDEWVQARHGDFTTWCAGGGPEGCDDVERTEVIVAGRGSGLWLPDDIMLRANTSTARDLLDIVYDTIDERACEVDGDEGVPIAGDLPEFLEEALTLLLDPHRPIAIGKVDVEVSKLVGDSTLGGVLSEPPWEKYVSDLYGGAGGVMAVADAAGPKHALWRMALIGGAMAGGLYPHTQWGEATSARASLGDTALDWTQVQLYPWTLTGREAYAVKADRELWRCQSEALQAAKERLAT